MRRRRRALPLLAGAGVLLAVLGLVVFRLAPPAPVGWFAYAPLTPDFPARAPLSALQVVGLVVAATGLTGAGAVAGFALGRRHRPPA